MEKGYKIDYLNGKYRALPTVYIVIRGKRAIGYRKAWDIDMEKVKSVIFYDKRKDFVGLPVVNQYLSMGRILSIVDQAGGSYVVEIRLHEKTTHKVITKNSRQTTFKGFTPVVEFYAPCPTDSRTIAARSTGIPKSPQMLMAMPPSLSITTVIPAPSPFPPKVSLPMACRLSTNKIPFSITI